MTPDEVVAFVQEDVNRQMHEWFVGHLFRGVLPTGQVYEMEIPAGSTLEVRLVDAEVEFLDEW